MCVIRYVCASKDKQLHLFVAVAIMRSYKKDIMDEEMEFDEILKVTLHTVTEEPHTYTVRLRVYTHIDTEPTYRNGRASTPALGSTHPTLALLLPRFA